MEKAQFEELKSLLQSILDALQCVERRLKPRVRRIVPKTPALPAQDIRTVVEHYWSLKGITPKDINMQSWRLYGRYARSAKTLLELGKGNMQLVLKQLEKCSAWAEERGLEWTLETLVKRWLNVTRK